MSWRLCPDDAQAEAKRLGLLEVTQRLGWSKRKLVHELERVASEEAFLDRVRRAIANLESDPPRLLHRDPARNYTHEPALAAPHEPESVSREWLDEVSQRARNERLSDWERKRASLNETMKELRADPDLRRHSSKLRYIERQLDDLDRRVRAA